MEAGLKKHGACPLSCSSNCVSSISASAKAAARRVTLTLASATVSFRDAILLGARERLGSSSHGPTCRSSKSLAMHVDWVEQSRRTYAVDINKSKAPVPTGHHMLACCYQDCVSDVTGTVAAPYDV